MERPDAVPWSSRLFGLLFGLPMAWVGTLGLIKGRASVGLVLVGLVAAAGVFLTLGVLSSSSLRYEHGALRHRFLLFGRLPLLSWTLVRRGQALGIRHIRRVQTFQSPEGEWLDEHFLVLATAGPREWVFEDLGTHPARRLQAINARARAIAAHHGLALVHEFDGRSNGLA